MASRKEATVRGPVMELQGLRSQVLARIATEVASIGDLADDFDTHIKNDCDIHGKGNHIKGSGPNYLKTSTGLDPYATVSQPDIEATRIRGQILSRIANELSQSPDAFDSHVKNSCDIHGKGDHIKGSGPNYLKSSGSLDPGAEVSNPFLSVQQFVQALSAYDALVDRISADVAVRLARRQGG